MKTMLRMVSISLLAVGVAACERQPVACTADSAQAPVVDIVKEQLEKLVGNKVRGDDGVRAVGLSKIRAAISQLVVSVEDIRTSKEDPNSTKRFCAGTLRIRFPSDTLADADKAREARNSGTVSDLADEADVERHADSFTVPIEFNVQPTDDGSKVFAETESGNNMFDFAAEVLASGLMRASLEDSRRQEQRISDEQAATQDAALTEQRNANVASAKTDNQLAVQTIGAVWKSLVPSTRNQLLPQQRAWIRKKDADCRVEAAAASIDPTEQESARLICDTRVTQERINWLGSYRNEASGNETSMAPAEASDVKDDF